MVLHSYGLVPPSSFEGLFAPIAAASEEQFANFLAAVNSRKGFRDEDKRCDELSKILDISSSDVGILLNVLRGIYIRFRSLEKRGASFDDLFGSFVKEGLGQDKVELETPDNSNQLVVRLSKLFQKSESLDEAEKLNRLRKGFLDGAVTFSSFVDLRPNYTDDRKKIVGYLPIVQLRISTDSDDASKQNTVFHLDSKAIDELAETIEDIKLKMKALANREELKDLVYSDRENS